MLEELKSKMKKCKQCGGVGYLIVDGKAAQCSCLINVLTEFHLSQSNIPVKFMNLDFSDYVYKNSDTYKKIQRYIQLAGSVKGKGMLLSSAKNTELSSGYVTRVSSPLLSRS